MCYRKMVFELFEGKKELDSKDMLLVVQHPSLLTCTGAGMGEGEKYMHLCSSWRAEGAQWTMHVTDTHCGP